MKFRSLPIPAIAGVVALSSCVISSSSRAAQLFKDSSGTDINDLAAWSTVNGADTPDPESFTAADELRFNENTAASGTFTMDLSAALTVGNLTVDSGTGTGGSATGSFVINSANGSTLTLNGNGGSPNRGIVLNSGTGGTLTMNAGVALGANQTWFAARSLTVAGDVALGARSLDFTANATSAISGVISGTGSLRHNGFGVLYLSNTANSFSGSITAVGGSLRVAKLADGGSNSSIGSGTGVIALNGAVLNYTGSTTDSTNRAIDLRGTSVIDSNGTGTISFTAVNVTNTGSLSKTLSLRGSNTGDNTLGSALGDSGSFSASLTKGQAGKWILTGANTYTGATTISGGILQLGNGGTTGALSASSAITNNANLTINRSDAVSQGTHFSSAAITGTGSLTQAGAGTTTLTAENTYSGATTVTDGTLALGASNVLADNTAVSIGAATLSIGSGFSDTVGTLDPTAAATIDIASGASLAFADSSAIDWDGGSLAITGTFVSGSSLRFGTTNAGLTGGQIGQITATGFTGFALDSNGFLTATATSGFSSWATANAPGQTIDQDHDGDGVSNGVEYFMGLSGSGFTANPAPNATTRVISWPKGGSYAGTYGTHYVIQISSDLGINDTWTPVPLADVTIDGDSVDYDLDTTPAGTRKFCRLVVTGP